jgi:mannose-6-phosphate isomerase
VEAGVPHAIGNGCLLIEIQEPTDFTLRTERTTPSGRVLPDQACHQGIGYESMFDCFHYETYEREQAAEKWKKEPRVIRMEEGGKEIQLIGEADTECFSMNKLEVQTVMSSSVSDTFAIAIVAQGKGILKMEGYVSPVQQSDRFFIPADAGRGLTWMNTSQTEDNLQVILCYPPK